MFTLPRDARTINDRDGVMWPQVKTVIAPPVPDDVSGSLPVDRQLRVAGQANCALGAAGGVSSQTLGWRVTVAVRPALVSVTVAGRPQNEVRSSSRLSQGMASHTAPFLTIRSSSPLPILASFCTRALSRHEHKYLRRDYCAWQVFQAFAFRG
jgi:hypothetical protein